MNIVDCYKVCLLVRLVSWSEAPREMLLLAAIHFHAGQLVADLVCQTLGIGKRVRTKSTTFIKRIFTQEIPVTAELSSSSITGYLPVHCIQHLLSQPTIEKAVFAVDLISTLSQGETGPAGAQPAGHREDSQGLPSTDGGLHYPAGSGRQHAQRSCNLRPQLPAHDERHPGQRQNILTITSYHLYSSNIHFTRRVSIFVLDVHDKMDDQL